MKTPSPYPVLDNRPIDQWRVTELKEELKKRKLPVKGLKEDLVRRLDEALRVASVQEEEVHNDFHATPQPVAHADARKGLDDTPKPAAQTDDIGVQFNTPQPIAQTKVISVFDGTPVPVVNEKIESKGTSCCESGLKESVVPITSVETNTVLNEVLPAEEKVQDGVDLVKNEETLFSVTSVETSVTITESVTHEVARDVQESMQDDLKTPLEDVGLDSTSPSNQVIMPPLQDDDKLNSSDPSNQVSDVSTVLGFQVKSDSFCNDSVSINEKNELKDNIIDETAKLELDFKPEMVHPSSSNVASDGSEPHPMDVEEGDDQNANLEMSKKNDSLDVGSSEKLNLDRSSGDDSLDDDTVENKPIDSSYNPPEGVLDEGDKEPSVIMSDDTSADKKDLADEMTEVPAAPVVKRKLNDQEVVGNIEISKRQRRWNTGTVKVPETQSNNASSTTPKDTFPATTIKRNFSGSDSTAKEETPKEREVPPSPKPPTTSLRIDRFLRPFTLKAVQELLGKTGSVISFWMDHIKTHCYVTYSSVEEAVETRNAVYNLQWPPNGGRLLLAEFVDPQEVKTRLEAPQPVPATMQPPPPPRQQVQRQQVLPPPPSLPLPPPPPLLVPNQARERLPPPPPLEKEEKIETPIVTLDDLFRKTKATPRIYYLPLTDEEVAAKRRR